MAKQVMNSPRKKLKLNVAAGFSVPELLIVVALSSVIASFAIISFLNANKGFKVAGATRTLSTYLEKARVDSLRRHGGASITIDSTTSYTVNIDFNGSGTATSRTIALPAGTALSYTLPPAAVSTNPSTSPITIS